MGGNVLAVLNRARILRMNRPNDDGTPNLDKDLRRVVAIVALLNFAYFGVEFAVATAIGSVSLFADSVDFFEDSSVNVLIFTALTWSAPRRARVGMALAGILLLPALALIWALWSKFNHPVIVLKDWLEEAKIDEGHLFRAVLPSGTIAASPLTDHEVPRIFKRLASRVDASGLGVTGIAGHSTRIGAAHDLVEAGFDVAAIANAGGWKSLMMPNYYTRELRAKQSAMAQLIRRRQNDE
jgi:Phage integrase family